MLSVGTDNMTPKEMLYWYWAGGQVLSVATDDMTPGVQVLSVWTDDMTPKEMMYWLLVYRQRKKIQQTFNFN